MKAGTTLIDFAGPGKSVYHITVGMTYPNVYSVVKELLVASGHIEAVDSFPLCNNITDNTRDWIKNAKQNDKINLFWVIPYGLETKWKNRVAFSMRIIDDDDPMTRLVKECFNSCVKQYVLVMDKDPLEQDEDSAPNKQQSTMKC